MKLLECFEGFGKKSVSESGSPEKKGQQQNLEKKEKLSLVDMI